MSANAYAVIMAGGRGERLWPLTAHLPKQFLPLLSEKTLVQETFARIHPLIPPERIFIVTGQEWVKATREQLPQVPEQNVIAEPMGRNTAPCIGLAAIALKALNPHSVMITLPADHFVQDAERFRQILKAAVEAASRGNWLVTLGIPPDRPATGYGYIQRGETLDSIEGMTVHRVIKFTEKPNEATAKRFLDGGQHWWNSGIFVWRVETILSELARHMPSWYAGLSALGMHLGTSRFAEQLAQVYQQHQGIAIDYGVMEKTDRAVVIPADIGWSDIGDWVALAELICRDKSGNALRRLVGLALGRGLQVQ